MKISIPKGTKDILPGEIEKYKYVQTAFADMLENFGYSQIRFPVFEYTELFQRGVGDTTDIVQKEMYTFNDKGGRSVTLRPEGTASVVRSYIENGMSSNTQPVKLYYDITAYRYENVQKGRYREFNQLGAEILGSDSCNADVEVLFMLYSFFNGLGIQGLHLNINSIGCKTCRAEYNSILKEYFSDKTDNMCADCKRRYITNPMRLLDCKVDKCIEIAKDAPMLLDNLCDNCKEHFYNVTAGLDEINIPYIINKRIVRGLDYYVRTVFEFIAEGLGAQNTVCAGGRYDGLVEQLGGTDTPGIGFAMGLERLVETMKNSGFKFPTAKTPVIFIGYIGEKAFKVARTIANELRLKGIYCEIDINDRSLKAQLKFADKKDALYSVVLGDAEIDTNKAIIKNMKTQETKEVSIDSIVRRVVENII
ncbi:MAG TPA: histidine--tRNA ligase [Clostridia bacterium]|jgi:histidyl-tRNA synthetase|nr:histidine--tRNA ligase [Clostridiaceae bacterium]HOF25838.1 histidine--tRNA ligase [Clostridia bacterium]HOM33719.1 histidine--tRNA ligase [Clostridia bacterium]HOR88863.1 histidine--tRNA ligase [Clostridia bacterium]HOT70997.1 histidine--tRNA ligase [Clostridia bacterium]